MMASWKGVFRQVQQRQIQDRVNISLARSGQVTPEFVSRIGLETELKGHHGCVNCLEWNEQGNLLASSSDDTNIIIWDPFNRKVKCSMRSGHSGNVFSLKFMPNSNDSIVVTGAADFRIMVHDLNAMESLRSYSSHVGRVKRLATAPDLPYMFWSASEDGTIMEFDLREPHERYQHHILVNLNSQMGSQAEAKCLAINPLQPHLLAVGANDPYVRLYDRRKISLKKVSWDADTVPRYAFERDNFLYMLSLYDFSLPEGSTQYYVAGHLPQKQKDYRKKYRTLASTYVTFSPNGQELLVNLGGEQIYLFDINSAHIMEKFSIPLNLSSNGIVKEATHTNGYHIPHGTSNVVPQFSARKSKRSKHAGKVLPPAVEALKVQANKYFEKQKYNQSILLYNRAIAIVPDSPILFGNRAAAYMKRSWDGDLYAALRDCHSAIELDKDHLKAHFRLAKCLFELAWTKEAADCLLYFQQKFPDYASSNACELLDRDIKTAISTKTEQFDPDRPPETERTPPTSARQRPKDYASDQEMELRAKAYDYELRFCGHCNTTTDIKEANFFGSNGQYIVAGSDDGSFFLWEKSTTNIVRVLRGDDSIVNCLQPHPTACIIATSGIDPVVRLWSPKPEDGIKNEREVDNSDDAACANQRRMNADPLEVMLMNMGYRITGVLDGEDDDDRPGGNEGPVQCRPS